MNTFHFCRTCVPQRFCDTSSIQNHVRGPNGLFAYFWKTSSSLQLSECLEILVGKTNYCCSKCRTTISIPSTVFFMRLNNEEKEELLKEKEPLKLMKTVLYVTSRTYLDTACVLLVTQAVVQHAGIK